MSAKLIVLALSAAFLLFGNAVRSQRHARLFPVGIVPRRADLLLALSMAQFLNLMLPLRLGDIVRIALLASRYRIATAYVTATVVVSASATSPWWQPQARQ